MSPQRAKRILLIEDDEVDRLAVRRALAKTDLRPVLLEATSCAEMIQRACARAGFVPHVVARATDFAVLLSLVAAGAGLTLVPGLATHARPEGVRLLSPAEPVTRQIFTVSRRGGDRKPAVRVVLGARTDAAARPSGAPLAA